MKHIDSTTSIAFPSSNRQRCGGRRNYSGRTVKTFEGLRVSKKVHSNINFSELDEVCLDVGKVDLSFSAQFRNDICISPQKGIQNNDFQEVSCKCNNGWINSCGVHYNSKLVKDNTRKTYSSFNQVEKLDQKRKEPYDGNQNLPFSALYDAEEREENWKGWQSSITFSKEHGFPLVEVEEGSKVSEVLVMSEDLLEHECKLLESINGASLNRKTNRNLVFDSDVDDKTKTNEGNDYELKEKLSELFANPSELHCFLESIDMSTKTLQYLASENKSCRKLNFYVPMCPKDNVKNVRKGSTTVISVLSSDNVREQRFLGFSDRAISSSNKYTKNFLEFCEKT